MQMHKVIRTCRKQEAGSRMECCSCITQDTSAGSIGKGWHSSRQPQQKMLLQQMQNMRRGAAMQQSEKCEVIT